MSWARPGPLVLALATGLISLGFYGWPAVDLAVAGWFFDGTGFPIAANRGVEALRIGLWMAEDLAFAVLLVLALRRRPALGLGPRDLVFLTLIFALGPGLLVNGLLKPFWGRPRPFQITAFGGQAEFAPAWDLHLGCCGYTSFVSGEMAGAMALAIALHMVLRAMRPRCGQGAHLLCVTVISLLPLVTAWQRMAAGRHFLSDVVISAFLILFVTATLRQALYGTGPTDPR